MANLPKQNRLAAAHGAAAQAALDAQAHPSVGQANHAPSAEEEWLDAVDDVDQSTIEEDAQQFPFAQWVHGDKKLAKVGGVPYTGGWFLNGAQGIGIDELQGEPCAWEAGELIHEQGDSTEGFFCRDLTFAAIRSRRCWRVRDGDHTVLYSWSEYDRALAAVPAGGGLSGRLQVLVGLQGREGIGPIVLTMGGTVSRAFSPSRQGDSVINTFRRSVLTPANAANRKRGKKALWPYRAFWLSVGPDRDDKGEPTYTTVGSKGAQHTVTLPIALELHDKMTLQEIGQRCVGRELLEMFGAWYENAETWATAWDAEALSGVRRAQVEEAAEVEGETAEDDPAYVAEEGLPF